MINVEVIEKGISRVLSARPGDNLLETLKANRIFVQSPCGGRGLCDKCLVRLLPSGELIKSCQTIIEAPLVIEVIPLQGSGLANWSEYRKQSTGKKGFGVAVDLGTTTLAIYLVDLSRGAVLSTKTCLNRQVAYGADVISRIKASNEGHLAVLADLVAEDINQAIRLFKEEEAIPAIDKMFIAGNPTMLHIIARISPESMGYAPYTPTFTALTRLIGSTLHLDASEVWLMPSISAFVGGDITMGMIASGLANDKTSLLIDLGTNGEMVLKHLDRYYCTSTATGPAFEGATITMGMGGVDGAINRVELVGDELRIFTVSGKAAGISGSGLVDLVAILIKLGLIDETGRFDPAVGHPLVKHFDQGRFFITPDVFVNQADIREFQLAKSAVISGVLTLTQMASVDLAKIDKVYLAGGFGFYLDLDNTFAVGILPSEFKGKIQSLGNASGQGLIDCLLDHSLCNLASRFSRVTDVIDLATNRDFVNRFVEHMLFT